MDDDVHLVCVSRGARVVWELHTPAERVGYLDALEGDRLRISHIGVDPRYRRRGHATRLLHAVLAHTPVSSVALTAAPFPSWRELGLSHSDLRAWYMRHGFRSAPDPQDPYRMVWHATPR